MGAKRGISLFRAKEAVNLGDTDFMSAPEMASATASAIEACFAGGLAAGAEARVVLRQSDAEGGFSLVTNWVKPSFPLPRHTHDADCLYYVLAGTVVMGRQALRPGDGFFVPKGAPYQYSGGPDGAEVLEIRRGVETFDMKISDITPESADALKELTEARRAQWESLTVSPIMAAIAAS